MKKIYLAAIVALLVSCGESSKDLKAKAEKDSLQNVIDQKDGEINDLMGTFNEIQEGFSLINEAENRVNIMKANAENNGTQANIRENMKFIQERLQENRQKIEELQRKLNNSTINAHKFKEAATKLEQMLEEKNKELEELRMQLQLKDEKIAQLNTDVTNLQSENETMKASKEQTELIARNQDEQLNAAWYVVGTNKQLKEHKILSSSSIFKKGKVLKEDFDLNFMTKIDIRKTTVIPLSSKSAEILTTHPAGTYTLLKDSKGLYTLRISDPAKFWSVSKYLVIKVK
ncbi:MAG: hypothetical protein IJR86_00245 [Bacteroidaceae bacterium]|jgi:chromosome segregation ATPase|nr:hypothetical protein [Bacteroidaceae bacterium]